VDRIEISDRLSAIFRDVFDDESIEIHDESTAADLENWDSLSHISLILAVEQEFSIRLAATEVGNLKNVGQMIELIQARTAK